MAHTIKLSIPKLLTAAPSLTSPYTAHGSWAQRGAGSTRAESLGPPAAAPLLHLEPCNHQQVTIFYLVSYPVTTSRRVEASSEVVAVSVLSPTLL